MVLLHIPFSFKQGRNIVRNFSISVIADMATLFLIGGCYMIILFSSCLIAF